MAAAPKQDDATGRKIALMVNDEVEFYCVLCKLNTTNACMF